MSSLVFTRRTVQTVSLEVINDEGEPQYQCLLNRFKDRDIRFLASVWREPIPVVTAKLNEVCEVESTEPYDVVELEIDQNTLSAIVNGVEVEREQVTSTEPLSIRVRDIGQLQSHGVTFTNPDVGELIKSVFVDTWNHAKDSNSSEFLIEWNDTNRLSCLDIDYHHIDVANRPSIQQLKDIVSSVRPQPFCWHPSHGKGCKLYYIANPAFTAKELAAIAGLSYIGLDCTATFDLIKSSRHPCYHRKRDDAVPPITKPDDIVYPHGCSDLTEVKRLLVNETDRADIEAYLQDKGWQIGQTLPHSLCPIDSTQDSKPNVYVGDKGLFCHRCFSKGLGSIPGFKGYGELIGCIDNRISTMVKNFCHLEHAKVVLANLYPTVPSKILEDIYHVMLKVVHGIEDPRIYLAIKSGTGFVRIKGMWAGKDGDSSLANGLPAYIGSLPATKYVKKSGEDAGKLIPDTARVTAFLNDGDLEEYGYPDISFLRGCKIFNQFNSINELVKFVSRKDIDSIPKYLPASSRMGIEDAWQILESEFPGIDRKYVKLLIATKGASEGRLCQCPFLLVKGPSGAGKSTTVHIAAGICGDKADEPTWNPNVERFRQMLMDGVRNSGFICVNEVFKYASQARITYTQALDPMLSLTEDSRSHVLYVGSVPFGRLPVFVLTDINIPPEIIADRQLARRFTFYHLDKENFWEKTLVTRRIRPHQFRNISSTHNAAADSILSDVIDTYFLQPTTLNEIAADLSGPNEYSEDVVRTKNLLFEFYQAVLKAAPTSGTHANRYNPESGWKFIDKMHETQLLSLWGELCDGFDVDKWNRSRQIDQQDWSKIVGVDIPITCEYRAYKTQGIYIRFRSVDSPRKPKWLNGKNRE